MELDCIKRGSGLWSQSGVPHKGWINEGVEDLGDDRKVCEMCLTREIRYVHIMTHIDYSKSLEVGCVCAGHLEDDYCAAESREKAMKNRAAKRIRWSSLKWKISKNKQYYIEKDGYKVIILDKNPAFMGMIIRKGSDEKFWTRHCKTIEEAKMLSFDRITSIMAAYD